MDAGVAEVGHVHIALAVDCGRLRVAKVARIEARLAPRCHMRVARAGGNRVWGGALQGEECGKRDGRKREGGRRAPPAGAASPRPSRAGLQRAL